MALASRRTWLALLLAVSFATAAFGQSPIVPQTVTFPAMDGLTITADLYESGDRSNPVVVLFHQSVSSRGEYRTIAPRIAGGGRSVLAVDLRWGGPDRWNHITNATATAFGTDAIVAEAQAGDTSRVWPTIFLAYNDMLSAIDWLSGNDFTGPTIIVGSSFSAMLALRVPSERDISGVVAFSPGEYYQTDSTLARRWAGAIELPSLIVGGSDEGDLVAPIFASLKAPAKRLFVTEQGRHGASVLLESDEAWNELESFLTAFDPATPVRFQTADEVTIHGDWYETGDSKASALLLHQGGSNAGAEYALTVPVLRRLGYDVLAIDLRRGGDRFGGANRTVDGLSGDEPGYCDAYPDLEAALAFLARERNGVRPVVFGSSFSAALAIKLAAEWGNDITAVLAFSPASGEPMDGCRPESFADSISIPVFVARPAGELHFGTVNQQLSAFAAAGFSTYVARNGVHGSSMLNPRRVMGTVNENWAAVTAFLAGIH